jgi:hypothetical protein
MGQRELTDGYSLFVHQMDEAITKYQKLQKDVFEGRQILKGDIDLIDYTGKLWDVYSIEIHFEEGFPYSFPSLVETGGKIPKIADWHVYEDTGSCCVEVLPLEILRCLNGITLNEYIKEFVLPYLFNQTHRRIEGYYVNGEYAHGLKGIYEFYSSILNTNNNIKLTVELMNYIGSNGRPERTSACFCGSGNKYRNCHKVSYEKLKPIGKILNVHASSIAKAAGLVP